METLREGINSMMNNKSLGTCYFTKQPHAYRLLLDLFTRKFNAIFLLEVIILSLLFNSLHKGNIYTLWKLWNLEEGVVVLFFTQRKQLYFVETLKFRVRGNKYMVC